MRFKTRSLAFILCAALLLSLCACQKAPAQQERPALTLEETKQKEAVSLPDTLAGGGYFEQVAREELSFADMALAPITLDDFKPYAQALTDAAASGSREAFHRACVQAEQMLTDMDTAGTLFDLESDRDASDQARSAQASAQRQDYYDASDLYDQTLSQIAAGENAKMLQKEFLSWQIELFESYDEESSEQGLALTDQESQFIRQYALDMSQDEVDVDAIAELYLELVDVRAKIADLAGAPNYSDYAYSAYYSRDYTPADAQKIWKTAKEDFAPILHQYSDVIGQALRESGVDRTLDCSDTAILDALRYGAARMSPEIRTACEYLLRNELYDIAYSEEKLSTGYTAYLYSYEIPYIFNCPYGSHLDYADMFHEFGHWLAGFYHTSDARYGVADYDLSELQSQGMEIMFLQFYDELFADDAPLLRAEVLLNLVYSVVTGAMYDEFQQRVYLEPGLTKQRLLEIYREVYASYGFEAYDGYEYAWIDVIHNFQQPLYYISYAVSAIPALELYVQSVQSPRDAMDTYLRAASMGDEEYYLTDVLRETGLSNSMKSPIGDVIAQKLVETGAFDIS